MRSAYESRGARFATRPRLLARIAIDRTGLLKRTDIRSRLTPSSMAFLRASSCSRVHTSRKGGRCIVIGAYRRIRKLRSPPLRPPSRETVEAGSDVDLSPLTKRLRRYWICSEVSPPCRGVGGQERQGGSDDGSLMRQARGSPDVPSPLRLHFVVWDVRSGRDGRRRRRDRLFRPSGGRRRGRVRCGLPYGARGVVSKHRDRPYTSGPCKHWVKVKNPTAPAVLRFQESLDR